MKRKQAELEQSRQDAKRFYELPVVGAEMLTAHRDHHIRIRAYMNRFTAQLPDLLEGSEIAFALFDPDGCLLKLFSNQRAQRRLTACGVTVGTLWSRQAAGENAVSQGLEERRRCFSWGEENACLSLRPFALYFAPILGGTEKDSPDAKYALYGGLALIVPVELRHPDYNIVVYSASNDISMHMHLCELYYHTLEERLGGMLVFDVNITNGNVTTVYHSANIFDIFGIAPVDIYFRPAEAMIDPPPQNESFWEIITQRKKLKNHSLDMSIRGKPGSYIVSSMPYYLPQFRIQGVKFLITTPQIRTAEISKQIANNAVRNFENIIGDSVAVQNAVHIGKAIASSESNIMLLGESGVGKDMFAQAIHNAGKRKNKPFIAINCGALPRDLIASELFGYDEGAFTGAKRQGNLGKFELANGGTLFLDEIGELPMDLQASLLRVVEQKKVTRLGGNHEISVDVRIISATNADIKSLIAQKKFRADLYYRLNTLRLLIPPLRERGDDAVLLAEHFIASISRRIGKQPLMKLSDGAKELIRQLSWPGNIRELQNVIEAVVQLNDRDIIIEGDILAHIDEEPLVKRHLVGEAPMARAQVKMPTREEIQAALRLCGGNRSRAAQQLGIARRTLYNYMAKYGL